MESEYERSRIERAKRDLYDPKYVAVSDVPELSKQNIDTNDDWSQKDAELLGRISPRRQVGVYLLKFMIIAAMLSAVFSVGYLAYVYYNGTRNSPENIVLTPDVPVSVTSGATNNLRLVIENRNRDAIHGVILTVQFPDGTKRPEGIKDVREEKKIFGDIKPGDKVVWEGSAAFFGKENSKLDIVFTIDYRFEGISSTFQRSVPRSVRVSTAPISVLVNTLDEVNAGQTIDMEVVVSSNTTVALPNLVMKAEYPQGFTFLSSDPPAFGEKNAWTVGTLEPGGKYVVRLRGVASGEEGQKRAFRFLVGPQDERFASNLKTEYANILREITLRRSFIGVELFFGDKPIGDSITSFGQAVQARILWKNNLPVKILDAQIEVKLSGSALDRRSVKAGDGGFYRSIDNSIIWEQRTNPELALVDIGEQGSVSFEFVPLSSVSASGELLTNPTITAEISVRGKRILETGVPEEVRTISVRTVRVTSEAQFASKAIQTFGPIINHGPIPPKAEVETTYTIVWTIINSSNDVTGATVRAVLPPNVRFTGTVFPFNEPIVYNDTTKEVIWSPGNIPAGTGITSKPREVYFQVAVLPSISQIAAPADLLYPPRFTAQDVFTGAEINQQRERLTTSLSFDPNVDREDAAVVP
jgi:hypothetical protein